MTCHKSFHRECRFVHVGDRCFTSVQRTSVSLRTVHNSGSPYPPCGEQYPVFVHRHGLPTRFPSLALDQTENCVIRFRRRRVRLLHYHLTGLSYEVDRSDPFSSAPLTDQEHVHSGWCTSSIYLRESEGRHESFKLQPAGSA